MKALLKQAIVIIMVISLVLSVAACGNGDNPSSDLGNTDSSNNSSTTSDGDTTSDNSQANSSDANSSDVNSSDANSDKNNSSDNQNTSGKLGSVPKELKGTTLKVLSWNDINDVAGAADAVKKFRNQTGISVTWLKVGYDEYQSKLAAMVASNDSPDVLRLEGPNPALLSLMDPVTVSGYDFKEDIWDSFISKLYTFGGKTFAVNRENTLIQQPDVMLYNKSYVTQYDLDDPYVIWKRNKDNWNMDTFLKICEDYMKVSGASTPWLVGHIHYFANIYGTSEVVRDGDKFVNNMGDANLLKAYRQVANCINKKIAYADTWDYAGFNQGKYLFFSTAIIGARRTHFYFKDLKNAGSLGVVPMPSVKGQGTYYQNLTEAEAYGIAEGAKNAKAVPYFLSFYLNGDNYDANLFFNDKTMLDVYNYCMNETTLRFDYTRTINKRFYGGTKYTEYDTKLKTATVDQITTLFNTYKPVVDTAVKSANDKLKEAD